MPPPTWSSARLDRDRQLALEAFIQERGQEGTRAYRRAFLTLEPVILKLFEQTDDLLNLEQGVFLDSTDLLDAARYLAGPPISSDDLATLTGGRIVPTKQDRRLRKRLARLLQDFVDPIRLPWLPEGRRPTEQERTTAIRWTAGLWAVERVRTLRRTEASQRQEKVVADLLQSAGYRSDPTRGRIHSLDDLARGCFRDEADLAGAKCDIPVRLFDGRLLALECKVSNSALNSVKRLIRETGGKARIWNEEFGRKVVTGVVLSGVYKLANLVAAQEDHGIALFWQHNLTPLRAFVSHQPE